MRLEEIKQYIKAKGIDEQTNRHEIAYQRYFLCNYIRKRRLVSTLQEVASVVGYKKHDNVLHAIKRHNELEGQKVYKDYTLELRTALKGQLPELDLKEELLACETLIELHRLQTQVKKGLF